MSPSCRGSRKSRRLWHSAAASEDQLRVVCEPRSDVLTSAAARVASLFKMMDVSRHKSVDTLRGYVRDADAFRDHAGAGLL
jgi:hypothetical protein